MQKTLYAVMMLGGLIMIPVFFTLSGVSETLAYITIGLCIIVFFAGAALFSAAARK